MHAIVTVINYCTNDYRFLDLCISEASKFSQTVIVAVADHFFSGEKENRALLERSYSEHPDCLFVEYAFDPERPYGIYCPYTAVDPEWIKYWHSTSRYVGFQAVPEEAEYVLFLDVDEIVDAERFQIFLDQFAYREFEALRFYSYFYFRQPCFRAKSWSLNALMVRRKAIESPEKLLTAQERKGVFDNLLGPKIEPLVGLDDQPLVHHYSWVRTDEELFFKVKNWGHALEKDWTALLHEELSHPFLGTEKLYGLSYDTVEARHNPFALRPKKRGVPNVQKNLSE
ncbi:MAG: hypothetical protein HY069_03210 [Chlamydiia bacterium]|nr:hypothetical protein [Chlamydiia bacterium]